MRLLSLIFINLLTWISLTAFAATDITTVGVEGMTCQSCVNSLTEAFHKAGFTDVTVSLEQKTATVNLSKGQTLDEKKLVQIVESVGFKAKTK